MNSSKGCSPVSVCERRWQSSVRNPSRTSRCPSSYVIQYRLMNSWAAKWLWTVMRCSFFVVLLDSCHVWHDPVRGRGDAVVRDERADELAVVHRIRRLGDVNAFGPQVREEAFEHDSV